jgi:hypothetical protein
MGTDGSKNARGRKRHVVIDTPGLLLVVVVTAANVDDARLAGHEGAIHRWQQTGHEWTGIVQWQTNLLSCIRTRDVVVCEARPASALALASDNVFGHDRLSMDLLPAMR